MAQAPQSHLPARPSDIRISICGVIEYRCHGPCREWVREHHAVWVRDDGTPGIHEGHPYCRTCAPGRAHREEASMAG